MLKLKNIVKDYVSGDTVVKALKGIDIQFRENEFVSVLGPSGCGKTTLLNIIGGLDRYTEGDLVINGRSTKDYKDKDRDTYRNHSIGFVFQSFHLLPKMDARDNVALPLLYAGVPLKERRARAEEALKAVGLEDRTRFFPNQLSGGQCQRVAIARAMALQPDILCFDEPTAALDPELTIEVRKIIRQLAEEKMTGPERAVNFLTGMLTLFFSVFPLAKALNNLDKEFYLVSDGNRQYLVMVTNEFVESRELSEMMTETRGVSFNS